MRSFQIPQHLRDNPPTVILGQPGSGKTRELVNQVRKLLSDPDFESFTEPFSFVSYTKAGVAAGLARLDIDLKSAAAQYSGTLHALCRRYGDLAGREFSPHVGAGGAPGSADADILSHYRGGGEREPGSSAMVDTPKSNFDRARHSLGSVDDHREFTRAMKKSNLADFTESMFLTVEHGWQAQHRDPSGNYLPVGQIFIDEAQDLTPLMWRLIFERFPPDAGLCIAGDPRQTLYEHQGVDRAIFHDLIQLSLDAGRVIHQPICHRVPRVVYKFATHVARGFNDAEFWSSAGITPRSEQPGGHLGHIISDEYLGAVFDGVGAVFDRNSRRFPDRPLEPHAPELDDIAIAYLTAVNSRCRIAYYPLAEQGICPVVPDSRAGFRWLWSHRSIQRYMGIRERDPSTLTNETDINALQYAEKAKKSEPSGAAFKKFLEVLSGADNLNRAMARAYDHDCAVLVSTIHRAKGLEFPWVILNWHRGMPGEDADYLPAMYVGVTRCQVGLMIHRDWAMRDPGIPLSGWFRDQLRSEEDERAYRDEVWRCFQGLSMTLKSRADWPREEQPLLIDR